MVQPVSHRAFPGSFLLRSRPKHLVVIIIFLTFVSMSALFLRSNNLSDSYFGVHEKLKGDSRPAHSPHPTNPAWTYPALPSSTSKPELHPMESLVEQGKARFKEVTSRQSKSLAAAIKEYQRRYKRSVPDGFADWYAFAKEHNVARIDEYDDLMRWFEPFRKTGASTLKSYIEEAMKGPAMSKFSIRNHSFGEGKFWHEREFKHLLEPILSRLPDMEVLINEWDEPRVLLGGSHNTNDTAFKGFQLKSYKNAYVDLVENPCKGHNISVNFLRDNPFHPYLSDVAGSKDVCRTPEVGKFYGMVQSPNALSVTESPVPLLSMSKLSSVGDLTYPNVLYIEGFLDGEYNERRDPPWDRKHNNLYWTGRTSGGLANSKNDWHIYHRQRFVAAVNGLVNTSLSAEFQRDKDLYRIRFPAVNQCDTDQCEEMKAYFGIDEKPDPFDELYKHKFLFDMDGNVFSRRFYSLMFSRSTVLKQTWQQEYMDEWLFPYVHYIPVSMDFEELPEMMRFLIRTEAGQKISEEIAEAGREWALQTFRPIEGTSYFYRLLLEYAELFRE